MELQIEGAGLNDWLETLKPYQSNSLRQMIDEFGPEDAAKRWLSANGPSSTVGFGGVGDPEPFFDRFLEEFRKFVCGDPSYEGQRLELGKEGTVVKTLLVSGISAAIGATLGYSATLLAPAVAIMLSIVASMGKNAWCAG